MLPVHPLLAWALLSSVHVLGKNIHSYAGPYILVVERTDDCPSDGSIGLRMKNSHFNPAKPYEKQIFGGNASLKIPFDDSLWIHVNLAVRSNNQWKENAFILNPPGGACSMLRRHAPTFFAVMQKVAPELKNKKAPCVVPVGEYHMENEKLSWEFPSIPIIPYGHYRGTITLVDKSSRTHKYCMKADLEAIPRPH